MVDAFSWSIVIQYVNGIFAGVETRFTYLNVPLVLISLAFFILKVAASHIFGKSFVCFHGYSQLRLAVMT